MSIEGLVRVQIERAERVEIGGLGTISVKSQLPAMVEIVNLSRTGCLFQSENLPAIGSKLSIGIPGIGSRQAIVVRSGKDGIGCAFTSALRPSDVDKARAARTSDQCTASAAIRRLRRLINEKAGEEQAPSWLSRLSMKGTRAAS
jgi:hypothetical protein